MQGPSTDESHSEQEIPSNMPVLEARGPFHDFCYPDNGWDHRRRTLRTAMTFSVCFFLLLCASVGLITAGAGTPLDGLKVFFQFSYYVTPFTGLLLVIMGSISIDMIHSPKLRRILDAANITLVLFPFVPFMIALYCYRDVCYYFPWRNYFIFNL